MSRPAICPACGRVHHERVPLACLACMVSDVEDTAFVEPPIVLHGRCVITPIYESPDDEEGNRIAYDMLYGDEPDFDPDDTQEHVYLFDEGEDDDGSP